MNDLWENEKNLNVLRWREKMKYDTTVYGAQWNYHNDLKEDNLEEWTGFS